MVLGLSFINFGTGRFNMSVVFKYKDFIGSIEVSTQDKCLYGSILYVNDLITYEAKTVGALEKEFKKALQEDFNIQFHNLFAITNLPISRFLDYLIASENYEDYMYSLVEAYNPSAVANVMCTNTISVSWDGWLYDWDFNQILDLKVASKIKHIKDYNEELLQNRDIIISQHCYGCTAGAGSSCQGSVA